MNTWLRNLLIATSVSALAACGGGGSSSTSGTNPPPTDQTVSMALSGVVYDEELANAEVAVYVGTSTTPVGSGTTDSNGNYDLNLTVAAADLNQACVIRAVRGDFSLVTLPGTVQTVADAAVGGAVSSENLPGINVTNVSTAQFAVIKSLNNGELPNDQTTIDALEATIETNANGEQDDVLQVASAIKAVIDSGAALPSASTDTEDLADDLLATTVDPSVQTFLTDNATEIAAAETEITSDPILTSQLIVSDLLSADIAGNSYTIGQETLLILAADGTLTVVDGGDMAGVEVPGTGSWTLDEATQVLTMPFTDESGSHTATVTITGGTAGTFIGDVVFDGSSQGSLTLRKVVDASTLTLPLIGFDVAAGRSLELPSTCTGSETAFAHQAEGEMLMTCSIVYGAYVLTPFEIGGLAVTDMEPMVVVPLIGTDIANNVVNYAMWEFELDLSTGMPLQASDVTTTYGKARLPVNKTLPVAGSVALFIEADGTPSIRLASTTTAITIHKLNLAADTKVTVNKSLAIVPSTDVNNPYDFDVMTSTNDANGKVNYVFALPGGTIDPTSGTKVVSYGAFIRENDGGGTTRIQYAMAPIADADVSGKTFAINDLIWGDQATLTLNADGSGSYVDNMGTNELGWSIGATSGTLEVNVYDAGAVVDTYTFYKGKVDLGAGSMILGAYADTDVFAAVATEQ